MLDSSSVEESTCRNSYIVGFLQLGWHWQCACVRVGAHYICVFKFPWGDFKIRESEEGQGSREPESPVEPDIPV